MTIHQLIAGILKIPASRVTDETTMKDVAEWDSLKHMEIIVTLEQRYSVELTGDEIAEMLSLTAIRRALERRGVWI